MNSDPFSTKKNFPPVAKNLFSISLQNEKPFSMYTKTNYLCVFYVKKYIQKPQHIIKYFFLNNSLFFCKIFFYMALCRTIFSSSNGIFFKKLLNNWIFEIVKFFFASIRRETWWDKINWFLNCLIGIWLYWVYQ